MKKLIVSMILALSAGSAFGAAPLRNSAIIHNNTGLTLDVDILYEKKHEFGIRSLNNNKDATLSDINKVTNITIRPSHRQG